MLINNLKRLNLCYKTNNHTQMINVISELYKIEPHTQAVKQTNNTVSNLNISTSMNAFVAETNYVANAINSEIKIPRSFSYESINSFNLVSNNGIRAPSTNDCSLLNIDPLLMQNIDICDDFLKYIVIADERVGKTTFINNILSSKLDEKSNKKKDVVKDYIYKHTESLEIRKRNIQLLGKKIRLELWDTNKYILDSMLCYSKI